MNRESQTTGESDDTNYPRADRQSKLTTSPQTKFTTLHHVAFKVIIRYITPSSLVTNPTMSYCHLKCLVWLNLNYFNYKDILM